MAKYLATSLAMEKVVSVPRVMSNCFPISTISMSLVGSLSKSTILPASLAAWVPLFMATPTSACASAGASLVPSPIMATKRPSCCSLMMYCILSSGLASAIKSSTPAFSAINLAVKGLSPVTITVLMPILRRRSKRSLMPGLIMSCNSMTPITFSFSATTSGVPPLLEICWTILAVSSGKTFPATWLKFRMASEAPFRMRVVPKSIPELRVSAVNFIKRGFSTLKENGSTPANSTMDFPSGVSSAMELRATARIKACVSTPFAG